MARRRTCSLLPLLTLLLAAGAAAQPLLIEDVGPDGDDIPGSPAGNWSASGLIAAIDGSGPETVAGPPATWSSRNGPDWVEHVAAVDPRGHLKVFYRQPEEEWKVVDVTEKTGTPVAVEEPAAWLMPEAGETDEKLAIPSEQGDLLVFRWHSGSDWLVENLTQRYGPPVEGAVSAWVSSGPGGTVEYIAARGFASKLILYYRRAGGAWKYVDVTGHTGSGLGSRVGAGPTGWTDGDVEYIAAPSPVGYLLLFSFSPEHGWDVANLSALTHHPDGPTWRVEGQVARWSANGGLHLAARAPDGDLLVFTRDPIEGSWRVTDLYQETGRRVATAPTFWEVGSGGGRVEHLAAADAKGNLVVFYRGSGTWKAVDVGSITGRETQLRPTSWVTPESAPPLENVASTSPDGNLVVSSWRPGRDWIAENASRLASGRVLYAASENAGVWRSDDYGRFWRQLSQPQPGDGAAPQGTLDVSVVLDVAVSPADPRIVLVGTGSDHRTHSRAGLYRSTDGGTSWQRVAKFERAVVEGGVTRLEVLPVSEVTFAPDDPDLAFAVGGSGIEASTDGGRSWSPLPLPDKTSLVWHLAVGEADATGRRPLAALGPTDLWFAPRFDAHAADPPTADWVRDGTVYGAERPATTWPGTGGPFGTSSHLMTFVPGSSTEVLVADQQSRGQSAPRYYGKKPDDTALPAGDPTPLGGLGSLWKVDLSRYDTGRKTLDSKWYAVESPAIYSGAGSSGVTYVYTHGTAKGFLVFFANENTVQVSEGVAGATKDWHRLDGLDASKSRTGNRSFVHPDPHDLFVSASFDLTLVASESQKPFDKDKSLGTCGGGRLWMANDGGVVRSSDCGGEWKAAEDGLDTQNFMNVAVSPRKSGDDVKPYLAPYLYGGTTHTEQALSPDGGATWKRTSAGCGDCDAWFSDPAQPSHVLVLMPRPKEFLLYVDSRGGPDASQQPAARVPYPDYARPFAISFKVLEGYRPIVYSLPGEANLPRGDYITLKVEGQTVGGSLKAGNRVLLRARDTFTRQSGAAVWEKVSGPVGAPSRLPQTADVVQAAGGHQNTVFFVGDGQQVWRSDRGPTGTIAGWEPLFPNVQLHPSLAGLEALRYFVNPYDPREVYVVSADAIRHTTDGGATWPKDPALDDALTESGSVLRTRRKGLIGGSDNPRNATQLAPKLDLLPGESENLADEFVLNDMVFDRGSSRRFAVGLAGVFFSQDGTTWRTLIDSRAIPGRPRAAWFDAISDPRDQALYVAYHGRGILKVHPIPPPSLSRAEMQSGTRQVVPPPPAPAEMQSGTRQIVPQPPAPAEMQSGTRQIVPPPPAPAEMQSGTRQIVPPPHERCERYADQAVALVERARELRCGFSGPRWTDDRTLHRDWCLRQQGATVDGEARAREDELVRCAHRAEGAQPMARAPEPMARAPEPMARAPEPMARAPEPTARAPEATAKAPKKLEMMQGQFSIVGSGAKNCELYAITAVAQERQNRERGCHFVGPGWNPDARSHRTWCERQGSDVLAAETKTRGIDLERCLAGRETAVGTNERCTTYAATAVLQARLDQRQGCGHAGPRWNTDFLLHYHWCEGQPPAVPDAETAERQRLLTQCGVPVVQ